MPLIVLLGSVLLGVLSRIEEVTPGFSAGISSNSAWVVAAFLTGALCRGPLTAAAAAAAAMTTANLSYYALYALTEPGVPLEAAAGRPAMWLALGLATGAVFAPAGQRWVAGGPAVRLAASLPLAAVLVLDGASAFDGGAPADAIGLALGLGLLAVSAGSVRDRAVAAAAGVLLLGLGATGAGALLP